MDDLISRQAAIDVIEDHKTAFMKLYNNLMHDKNTRERGIVDGMDYALADLRAKVLSAQPEPSIPISWIKERINWLKDADNIFAKLSAMSIEVLLEKWMEGENDESVN